MKYKIIFIIGLFTAFYVVEIIAVIFWFVLFKGDGGVFENLKMAYSMYRPSTRNIGIFWVIRIITIIVSFISLLCFRFIKRNTKSVVIKFISSVMIIINIVIIFWLLVTLL